VSDEDDMPFYVWLLPLLCGICSYVHHKYPGDEKALWLLGSAPGLWIAPFAFLGKASKAMASAYVALALAVTMLPVGWVMDRLRVRRALWAATFPICVSIVMAVSVLSLSSVERAIARNGSWWAYILLSVNLGVYLSVIVSVLLAAVVRVWNTTRQRSAG